MIGLIFSFADAIIEVRINGHQVLFRNSTFGSQFATIDGIQLSYQGVVREFPELKDSKNWKVEAISKFKDQIKSLDSEEKISKYVVEDLTKWGYKLIARQKQGHRVEKIA
jgi:D-mannonate dehydratase